MKAKIQRQELGAFYAHLFSSSRADCKDGGEGGGNLLVSTGMFSMVGNDMPKVANHK